MPRAPSFFREQLLADLSRALHEADPDGAERRIRDLERAVAGESVAWSEAAGSAAGALRTCYPDRGAELASELRLTVALARLDLWLADSRPVFREALRPPAAEADFAPLEAAAGPLPAAFKVLYRWHDGQDEVRGDAPFFRECDLLPLQGSLAAIRSMERESSLFGDSPPAPDFWRREWVPFMAETPESRVHRIVRDDRDSHVWCLDCEGAFQGTPNQILSVSLRGGDRTIAFPDLETFFEVWTESLERNMWDVMDANPFDERAWRRFAAERVPGFPKAHWVDGTEDAQDR